MPQSMRQRGLKEKVKQIDWSSRFAAAYAAVWIERLDAYFSDTEKPIATCMVAWIEIPLRKCRWLILICFYLCGGVD